MKLICYFTNLASLWCARVSFAIAQILFFMTLLNNHTGCCSSSKFGLWSWDDYKNWFLTPTPLQWIIQELLSGSLLNNQSINQSTINLLYQYISREKNCEIKHCFGSASFSSGSGSADPLPWIVDPDLTADPTRTNSSFFFLIFFCKRYNTHNDVFLW